MVYACLSSQTGIYDLDSGELKWQFFIVPGDPKNGLEHPETELDSKTWDPNSISEASGGGTVWGRPVTKLDYIPEIVAQWFK